MLTHRTNVLLTEDDSTLLTSVAKKEGVTKSEVLRRAFKKVYGDLMKQEEEVQRKAILKRIKKHRTSLKGTIFFKDFEEFKAFRDYGKK